MRTAEADRSLVLRATEARDIVVEQAAPPVGTGVADRLGLGAVVGVPGRVRVGAPAAAATYDLSVAAAAPGPAIVLRTAVPIAVDLALAPTPGEVGDITAVTRGELALMIARRAAAVGPPDRRLQPVRSASSSARCTACGSRSPAATPPPASAWPSAVSPLAFAVSDPERGRGST